MVRTLLEHGSFVLAMDISLGRVIWRGGRVVIFDYKWTKKKEILGNKSFKEHFIIFLEIYCHIFWQKTVWSYSSVTLGWATVSLFGKLPLLWFFFLLLTFWSVYCLSASLPGSGEKTSRVWSRCYYTTWLQVKNEDNHSSPWILSLQVVLLCFNQ